MGHRIRVVLIGIPPLFADVVTRIIANEADMDVAGVFDRVEDVDASAGQSRADVFLLGADSEPPMEQYEQLLMPPRRRVIGVSADGRRMVLCELRPAVHALGALSARELVEVIRGETALGV